MVEPVYHKEKIMIMGNRLQEIRKSVNKKSQMSLRDMLVAPDCIICETVVKCMMFCRHITRNSVTVIINVPFHCTFRCLIELLVHPSAGTLWIWRRM